MIATYILAWIMLLPLGLLAVGCVIGWMWCDRPRLAAWLLWVRLPGRYRWAAVVVLAAAALIGADKAPPFTPLAWMVTVMRDGQVLDPSGAIGRQAYLAVTHHVINEASNITAAAVHTVNNALADLQTATNDLAHRTYTTAYLAQDLPRALPGVHTNSNIAASIQRTEMLDGSNIVAWVWFSEEPSVAPQVSLTLSVEDGVWQSLTPITNSYPTTTDITGVPCVRYVYDVPPALRSITLRPRYELEFGGSQGSDDYLLIPRSGVLVSTNNVVHLPYTGWDAEFSPPWSTNLAVRYSGGVAVEARWMGTNYTGRVTWEDAL